MRIQRPQWIRAAGLALVATLALGACSRPDEDNAAEGAEGAEEPVLNLPAVPTADPPIGRAELLAAVARAASAAAAGRAQPEPRRLDGRQFELRIRFGCMGPAANVEDAVLGWSFDPERRTLRLRAAPTISMDNRLVREIAGDRFEAVEGFWIPRPWLLEPVCPAAAAVRSAAAEQESAGEPPGEEQAGTAASEDRQETVAPPPAHARLGIAHFFTDADPRTRRRAMRPYETVKTLEPDQPLGSQGFDLVLSGRLRALPGGGVITCLPRGPDAPPDCIVSANIDRVRIEYPGGDLLAEWGIG